MTQPARNASVQTYAGFAKAGMSSRDLDASALMRSAGAMQMALADGDEPSRNAALTHNRRLWTVFAAAAADDGSSLPPPLRENILRLANFVFSQTLRATAEDAPAILERLIALNRELAAGLRGS